MQKAGHCNIPTYVIEDEAKGFAALAFCLAFFVKWPLLLIFIHVDDVFQCFFLVIFTLVAQNYLTPFHIGLF